MDVLKTFHVHLDFLKMHEVVVYLAALSLVSVPVSWVLDTGPQTRSSACPVWIRRELGERKPLQPKRSSKQTRGYIGNLSLSSSRSRCSCPWVGHWHLQRWTAPHSETWASLPQSSWIVPFCGRGKLVLLPSSWWFLTMAPNFIV